MKYDYIKLLDLPNEYDSPVFICNNDFFIIGVNDYIIKNNFSITIGSHLNDTFSSRSIDFLAAFDRVSKGLPFLSTNFDYNLLNATLCMFPLTDSSGNNYILCLLELTSFDDTLKSYHGSISPIISERYRSPVSGIMNVASILSRRFQNDEDYKSLEYLNHIMRCCYLMLNTTVSVQEYYMLVNNKRELNLKKLVLNRFIENLCRTLQVLFTSSGFKLEFTDTTNESIISEFDEDLLSLAIFQIISNSCKFSPKDSTITLSLSRTNDSAVITIADEGIGIDKKVIGRVLDPFFSFYATPVPEENIGIGLGLPLAKKIVEAHDGRILITSELNKGTTLMLSFPIKSNDSTPLTLNSDTAKYITDKFSNLYLIFSDICDLKLY